MRVGYLPWTTRVFGISCRMFFRGTLTLSLFLASLICFTFRVKAQVSCTPVFIREYKGSGYAPVQAHAVKALADGTMLVAGRTASAGAATYDGFISKHAADGTPLWTLALGGADNDDISGITPLDDGTFVLYGTTSSFGHPEGKGWLIHIDAAGAVLWSGQLGSSVNGTDRIKAIQPYPDGDIIGTLNMNDSSAASDPVVFKMGLDGAVRWTHRFDNGSDDSFTTLAVSGDTIYTGGYYSSGAAMLAVLTEIRAGTGAHLKSYNINNGDPAAKEQLTGLEIYNKTISYGLYVNGGTGYVNGIVLVQMDLAGSAIRVAYAQDPQGVALLKPIRSSDGGFFVLRSDNSWIGAPAVNKISPYGYFEWGIYLAGNSDYTTFTAFDKTADGGCVAAGHYSSYPNSWAELLRLVKMTSKGEVGTCNLSSEGFYANPSTYQQAEFSWANEPALTPLSSTVSIVTASRPLTSVSSCASSVCVDHTPIPTGCGKTYNIQYTSARSTELRDIIAATDGGRVAVGDMETPPGTIGVPTFDGMVMKYQSNGDIAWTKNYNIPGHNMQFRRILRMADGNLLVIGIDYYTANYTDLAETVLLKIDNDGNIIWNHMIGDGYTEVPDAAATSDNGFVLALYDFYGGGSNQFGYVARFDANANLLWQTQVSQLGFVPVFKAITCTQDAVFVAYDSYIYTYDQFGVDRLDLATGKMVYSKRYTGGGGTQVQVNSLFAVKDSVYAFLYHYTSGAGAKVTNLLFGLDQQGNSFRALNLGTDPLNPNPGYTWSHVDGSPPSVTMTADQDFWLASRVTLSGTNYLTVTRLKADGTVEFSKLHPNINNYLPYNVRPQGKGLVVVGAISAVHTGNPDFTNAFVLKLDSSGQLQTGAAASCVATDRPFPVTKCTTCGEVTLAQPPSEMTLQAGKLFTQLPYVQDNDVTPVLYCFQPGNCNAVSLQQKGKVCSLHDTLVYYLDHSGNCGAAATWNFDPAFFQPGLITGDSIQLIAQKAGSSAVGAQIEGYCSFSQQNVAADVVFTDGSFDLGPDTVVCSNGPLVLHAPPGYASYQWNDNSTSAVLTVVAAGQYTVAATDACGHTHNATEKVTDANDAFHVTADTIRCNNDVDILQASSGYSDYQWSPSYNLQQQDNEALVTPEMTTRYTVNAWRNPVCMVSKSVQVTVLSSPAIYLGGNTSICKGDSLLLDASAGFDRYQWSNGATAQHIYIHDPGKYWVDASFSNGCVSRDTLVLIGLYDPQPELDKNPLLCTGKDRVLDAGSGYAAYLWNDGSTGNTLRVSTTGEFWVRVTDQHDCLAADTVHIVTEAPRPANFLPKDTSVCQYGGLVLKTRQPYEQYSWSDLSAGSSLKVSSPGTYWVQVTDGNGCEGTDTVTVTGKFCLVGLFVPSAFSPDGNGHNDRFRPLVYGNTQLVDFAVFGRWGEKLFETQTPMDGWDGRIKGSPAPAGTYAWYCRYRPDGQSEQLEKGTVILVR